MFVECIDLDGNALITTFGALQFLSERNTDIHLITIQINDASTGTVHTHRVFRVENLVICVIHPFRRVARAIVNAVSNQMSTPMHAFTGPPIHPITEVSRRATSPITIHNISLIEVLRNTLSPVSNTVYNRPENNRKL